MTSRNVSFKKVPLDAPKVPLDVGVITVLLVTWQLGFSARGALPSESQGGMDEYLMSLLHKLVHSRHGNQQSNEVKCTYDTG